MGVSKEGRISEKLPSGRIATSAGDSADESSGGGTAASVAVAAGEALGEDEEDEWDFDRKAQVLRNFPSYLAFITHPVQGNSHPPNLCTWKK